MNAVLRQHVEYVSGRVMTRPDCGSLPSLPAHPVLSSCYTEMANLSGTPGAGSGSPPPLRDHPSPGPLTWKRLAGRITPPPSHSMQTIHSVDAGLMMGHRRR